MKLLIKPVMVAHSPSAFITVDFIKLIVKMFASPYINQYKLFKSDSPRPSSNYTHQRSQSFTNNIRSRFLMVQRTTSQIPKEVQENIESLKGLLENNDPTLMSFSLSDQQIMEEQDYIEQSIEIGIKNRKGSKCSQKPQILRRHEVFKLIKDFLFKSKEPSRAFAIYSKLLTLPQPYEIQVEPLLYNTVFSSEIYPLLSLYLQHCTELYTMRNGTQKILDIFYKYVFCEHGQIMEKNLKNSNFINLGKWFYEEGLGNMFRKYYANAQEFTNFFVEFMKYGVSFLFLAAISILENKSLQTLMNKTLSKETQIIKVAYIDKYGIS